MRALIIIPFILLFTACNNVKKPGAGQSDTVTDSISAPVFSFEHKTFDFGLINEGDTVSHDFTFINTGKSPLIITDAQASCGCTIPQYPHQPITPGGSGIIKVIFNSANKFGKQTKSISITSNTVPAVTQLLLTGEVKDTKHK